MQRLWERRVTPAIPDHLKRAAWTPRPTPGTGHLCAGGLSHKLARRPNRVFCIVGDGELNEGAVLGGGSVYYAHHRLNNLTVFIDWNKQQLDGELEEIINPIRSGREIPCVCRFSIIKSPSRAMISPDCSGGFRPVPPAGSTQQVVIMTALRAGVAMHGAVNNSHRYA